jgi:AraC-like DNA-binding protein
MIRSEVRRLHVLDLEHVQHAQPGQEWVPHWHAEWSFGAVMDGECRCSVAGQPFLARPGDLIAIAPGVVHTGSLMTHAHSDAVLVVMLYVPERWLVQAGLAMPACSGRVQAPEVVRYAREMSSAAQAEDWLRRAVPVLHDALQPATQPDNEPSASVRHLLEQVQAAILAGEQTVSGLAERCGVTRERIHRVLRQWTGMAPAEYLRAIRLQRAKELLISLEPPADVAAACGFADQAHFTRWFRRAFGYTPGDFIRAASAPSPPGRGLG